MHHEPGDGMVRSQREQHWSPFCPTIRRCGQCSRSHWFSAEQHHPGVHQLYLQYCDCLSLLLGIGINMPEHLALHGCIHCVRGAIWGEVGVEGEGGTGGNQSHCHRNYYPNSDSSWTSSRGGADKDIWQGGGAISASDPQSTEMARTGQFPRQIPYVLRLRSDLDIWWTHVCWWQNQIWDDYEVGYREKQD